MRTFTLYLMIGAALWVWAFPASAQLLPGDMVICHSDTSVTNGGGRVYCLNTLTSKVTTLLDKLTSNPTWCGNWMQMAPDNKTIWVAYYVSSAGAMLAIDQSGGVTTLGQLPWRTDGFRLTDDAGITWSVIGGSPSLTNVLFRTDANNFGNITTFASGLPTSTLSHQEIEDSGNYIVSYQATAPNGGVSEVDPITRTVVKSITGQAQVNTIEYHKANGMVYATEFGTLTSVAASAGSLYQYDLQKLTASSLIDATTPLGATVDRLNWIEVDRDNMLWLGARHKVFKYDPVSKTLLKTWTFEKDRLQAITGGTFYGNRPLDLDTRNAIPGGTVLLTLTFPHSHAPGASYFLSASFSLRPGIPLPGGLYLDLTPDVLFPVVLSGALDVIFQNFRGSLNSAGQATAQIKIPADPNLKGLRLFVGGVAIIQSQLIPTNCEGFTIR